MKTLKLLFGSLLILIASACTGPEGPPGFDGAQGPQGIPGLDAVFGTVLEIEGTFSTQNDYTLFFEFPDDVEVFESDIVLVYILFDQADDPNGGDPIDVWRPLPQTLILDQGLLQYNFDHTFLDVNIFLEADFDLGTLLPGDTDDQVFRIAVLPAEFAESQNIDLSNLSSVLSSINMNEDQVEKIPMD